MAAITHKSLPYLALAGYPQAYFGLYLIYKHGIPGVTANHMKARCYLLRAAETGHPASRWMMAFGYLRGWFGFPKNEKRASFWFRLIEKNWNVNPRKGDPVVKDILKFLDRYEFNGKDKVATEKDAK